MLTKEETIRLLNAFSPEMILEIFPESSVIIQRKFFYKKIF